MFTYKRQVLIIFYSLGQLEQTALRYFLEGAAHLAVGFFFLDFFALVVFG